MIPNFISRGEALQMEQGQLAQCVQYDPDLNSISKANVARKQQSVRSPSTVSG